VIKNLVAIFSIRSISFETAADPARKFRGAISVMFGSQVS